MSDNVPDVRDGWRVFRIMAEFVEGFETMSPVGKAVSILERQDAAERWVLPGGGGDGGAAGAGGVWGDHRRWAGDHGGGEQGGI